VRKRRSLRRSKSFWLGIGRVLADFRAIARRDAAVPWQARTTPAGLALKVRARHPSVGDVHKPIAIPRWEAVADAARAAVSYEPDRQDGRDR
jgi:hypothetical protein